MLDVTGMQEPIDHVEHEQRLHAVVGETLPRFRERDITQAARVSEKTAIVRIVHGEELERILETKKKEMVARESKVSRLVKGGY